MKKRFLCFALVLAAGMGLNAHAENGITAACKIYNIVSGEPSQFGYIEQHMEDKYGNTITPVCLREEEPLLSAVLFPDTYKNDYVTSVKNQSPWGTCWAFAAIGAIEANLAKNKVWDKAAVDFSEAHLAYFAHNPKDGRYSDGTNEGAEAAYKNGGNDVYTISALRKYIGTENEESTPYAQYAGILAGAVEEEKRYNSYAHIKRAESYNTSDIASMKCAIMNDGSLVIGYYSDQSRLYTTNDYRYYYSNSNLNNANHAVLIVGWDDNIKAEEFNAGVKGDKPQNDGAWIVKNSWGEKWGDEGYFYMSFDNYIATAYSYEAYKANDYDNNYGYAGAIPKIALGEDTAANVFTAEKNEILSGVGIWSSGNTDTVNISVYKNVKNEPDDGTLVHFGKYTVGGEYGEIKLNKIVELKKGERYSIVVSGLNMPLFEGNTDTTHSSGESYAFVTLVNKDKTYSVQAWVDTSDGSSKYGTQENMIIGNAYINALTKDKKETSIVIKKKIQIEAEYTEEERVYIAQYGENGELVRITEGTEDEISEAAVKAKAFLWDENMIPVTECVDLKV